MHNEDKILLQIPLKGRIYRCFDIAFHNSGLESRTEYIRSLIQKDYNAIAGSYSFFGQEPEDYELQDEDIKD